MNLRKIYLQQKDINRFRRSRMKYNILFLGIIVVNYIKLLIIFVAFHLYLNFILFYSKFFLLKFLKSSSILGLTLFPTRCKLGDERLGWKATKIKMKNMLIGKKSYFSYVAQCNCDSNAIKSKSIRIYLDIHVVISLNWRRSEWNIFLFFSICFSF